MGHVEILSPNCERAKRLTRKVCEMIARDIRPISIVDDVGFLSLMKETESRYLVPCRSTISQHLDDLYIEQKRNVRGMLGSVEFLCLTTDMWTSRHNDG